MHDTGGMPAGEDGERALCGRSSRLRWWSACTMPAGEPGRGSWGWNLHKAKAGLKQTDTPNKGRATQRATDLT